MDKTFKNFKKKCKNVNSNTTNFNLVNDEKSSKKSKKKCFQKLKDEIIFYLLENFFSPEKKSVKLLKRVLSYFKSCSFCQKIGHREKNCWKKSKAKLAIKNNKNSSKIIPELQNFSTNNSKTKSLTHTEKKRLIKHGLLSCENIKAEIKRLFIAKYPISENILETSIYLLKNLFSKLLSDVG